MQKAGIRGSPVIPVKNLYTFESSDVEKSSIISGFKNGKIGSILNSKRYLFLLEFINSVAVFINRSFQV